MSEELTRFQIQLLLYFFRSRAEKKELLQMLQDILVKTKVSVTRTLILWKSWV